MVAMVQLSIALGSTLGGLLFDHQGYQMTFFASAGLLIIASALIFLTSRADPAA
jgi:predicted MFS family arabinose efflux permease